MEKTQYAKRDSTTGKNGSRNGTTSMSSLLVGKLQPQAVPYEEAVLGAIMLDKNALPVVLNVLRPETFYVLAHQEIYRAAFDLFRESKPIDLLTMQDKLTTMGKSEATGGAYYLAQLTNKVTSSANVEYHARVIVQKFLQRELIRVSTQVIEQAYDETTDIFDLLDQAEQNLFAVTETNLSRSFHGIDTLAPEFLKQLDELAKKGDGITGIPVGFAKLDKLTAGFQRSDLIILAARPAMGKTACALSMALNAAMDFKKPVAFFTLEMSSLQIVQRFVSNIAEVDSNKLRTGKMEGHEWEQLKQGIEKLSKAPIFIDDTPGLNVFELRAKCRRLKAQHNIELVVIDYLQLMTAGTDNRGGGNREQEISTISRALKGLAKELNIPVIALSQLSRAVETRGGQRRPQLSDLRESGAIEQDADIVAFIYRAEYYGLTEDENGDSTKGMSEIIVSKHRNGSLENIRMRFRGEYAKFEDPDDFNFGSIDSDNVITRQSRMNDDENIPF